MCVVCSIQLILLLHSNHYIGVFPMLARKCCYEKMSIVRVDLARKKGVGLKEINSKECLIFVCFALSIEECYYRNGTEFQDKTHLYMCNVYNNFNIIYCHSKMM